MQHLAQPANETLFADQVAKFGAWGSDNLVGCYWGIGEGQELVPHRLEDADQIYIVLNGECELRTYNPDSVGSDYFYRPRPNQRVEPSPKFPQAESALKQKAALKSGDIVAVPAGELHSIFNRSSSQLVIFAVGRPAIDRADYLTR
ncbi:hypothetical protein ROS1_57890 [Roseibium sp. ROS1]